MGLHFLDFLSSSPEVSIFQKSSNKKNFGGFCIILYIIAFIIITVYYILNYTRQENYSINYSYYNYDKSHDFSGLLELTFSYKIFDSYGNTKSNISLYAINIEEEKEFILPINETIKLNFAKLYYLFIVYECSNDDCIIDNDINGKNYAINFDISTQTLHIQEDDPIAKVEGGIKVLGNFDEYIIYKYQYIETKCVDLNFFGRKERKILNLKDSVNFNLKANLTRVASGKKYRLFGEIYFFVDDLFWEQYIRKSKSWMEAIANICSVNSTIYSILKLVFTFIYSTTFDNYKIIQNLLVEKKRIKYINIQENNKEKSSDFLLNPSNNSDNLITYKDDNDNEIDNNNNNKNISRDDRGYLPKLNFWDYIFNTFYFSNVCCCVLRKQILISKCNDFISKYYSIENILRNQIKLENLWNEYKWNNEKLGNFENNESFEDIKKCAKNLFIH